MWFVFSLITFLAWGTADLFYKKGASVVLARIFLKEKLSAKQYAMVACVFAGILLLGIVEGLGA